MKSHQAARRQRLAEIEEMKAALRGLLSDYDFAIWFDEAEAMEDGDLEAQVQIGSMPPFTIWLSMEHGRICLDQQGEFLGVPLNAANLWRTLFFMMCQREAAR